MNKPLPPTPIGCAPITETDTVIAHPRAVAPKQRAMNGRRALDFRRGTKRMQRCSRCHTENELTKPVLYDLSDRAIAQPEALAPIMVGDELLGFCCTNCRHSLLQHIASVFPDGIGFPLVDHHGQLERPSRCDDCGQSLAYSSDGRSVVCPQCDTDALQRLVEG